jgi:hypothetical protein
LDDLGTGATREIGNGERRLGWNGEKR